MKTLAWRARCLLGKTTWLALETHECETKEKVGKTACVREDHKFRRLQDLSS